MTEYDYSEEGYQRYVETQDRISRWVDTSEQHRGQFMHDHQDTMTDLIAKGTWDGVVRVGNHSRDSTRHYAGGSHYSYPKAAPVPAPAPPPPALYSQQSLQTSTNTYYYPSPPPPPPIIITTTKRKSSKPHKSSRSHKSHRHREQTQTYIIQPPSVPPQPQYATYTTVDHTTGYPVSHASPMHPIPGSIYSYSTPPQQIQVQSGPGSQAYYATTTQQVQSPGYNPSAGVIYAQPKPVRSY